MSALSLHVRPRAVTRITTLVVCLCLSLFLAVGVAAAAPMPNLMGNIPVDAYEVDNVQAQAKTITVGAVPQEHTIHAMLNNDWVKFPAKAGSTYVIDNPDYFSMPKSLALQLTRYSGMRVVFELCDSAGTVLARSQNAGGYRFEVAKSSRFMSEQIVWKAPKAQTVYVRISSFPDMDYEHVGSYLVQVKSVVPQITGNVTTPDGKPAKHAYVATESEIADSVAGASVAGGAWSGASALTDEHGNYVLYGLDDGDYSVFFDGAYWQNSYLQDEFYDNVHEGDVAMPKSLRVGGMKQITGINAQLDLAPGFISGRVVDQAGKPVAGVRVEPYYNYGWGWSTYSSDFYAWTDANGQYVCRGGYDRTWRIGFVDDTGMNRYATEYWDDAASVDTASDIVVSGGSAPGSYDATLTSIPLIASGTIEDSAGVGISTVEVRVFDSQSFSWLTTVYADEDGYWEYHSATPPANAKFEFSDWEGFYASEWYDNEAEYASADVVTLSPSAPVVLDAVLSKYAPSLSGVVTDAKTGAPARGIQVWLYDYSGTAWFPIDSTVTDSAGTYRFQQVWRSDYIVKYFDPTGYFATEYSDNAASPFKAEWYRGELGSDIKLKAALQPQGDRVYGKNRFGTAVAAGKQAFPEWKGVEDVIIASGDDAAAVDPLASGSLSWAYDAPLLLTSKNANPSETIKAIKQIEAASGGQLMIHVVGGPTAIPEARLAEMASIVGTDSIERLPYGNRYETARQVALRAHQVALDRGEDPGTAFVVNGSDNAKFWDALSASAVAARMGAPVLLTPTSGAVPAPTLKALEEIAPDDVYVVGGTACVSASAYSKVGASARISGGDRYATSVKLAKFAGAEGWLSYTQVGLAATLTDGLTGGTCMGLLGGPVLITRSSSLPSVTYKFIDDNDQFIEHAVIFGGAEAVSGAVTSSVKQALKQ